LGHSGHSRVQLQAPLAWLDLRVRAEELLQEEALGLGIMASGVRVATITRFFSVDKRFEEEMAADRKSALAKWRDEENAIGRLARKKEAEATAEAKRLASKRPVGRPKKVRQVQAVLVGQEGEEGNLEDGGEEPPAKKKRGPYTNWFVPDLWNFIFAAVKKHPRNLYDALFSLQHNKKPGRLGSPFDKLTVQTLKGWFEKNEEGVFVLKCKVADYITLQNARKVSHKPRPTGIFTEFPETFELVCKTFKGVRDAGQPLDDGIIQGIMQGCIQQFAPEMFQRTVTGKRGEDVKFSVSKTFRKAFVRKHLGWTWRRVTTAASKLPED
jgi:hypothetical protein